MLLLKVHKNYYSVLKSHVLQQEKFLKTKDSSSRNQTEHLILLVLLLKKNKNGGKNKEN
jgi:hypothetical protein